MSVIVTLSDLHGGGGGNYPLSPLLGMALSEKGQTSPSTPSPSRYVMIKT